MGERYAVYYRVSTNKQGKSGLGLEAQRKTVMDYLNGHSHEIVGEFTEVESGGKDDRPELQKAITACRLKKARLVVAKLDRLSRDLHFITGLSKAGIQFTIAEQPNMNELTVHLFGALAEHERKLISQRTKQALDAAKERGVQLGNPCLKRGEQIPRSGNTTQANQAREAKSNMFAREVVAVIEDFQSQGASSLRQVSDRLNREGFRTVRGKLWQATSVARVIRRAKRYK